MICVQALVIHLIWITVIHVCNVVAPSPSGGKAEETVRIRHGSHFLWMSRGAQTKAGIRNKRHSERLFCPGNCVPELLNYRDIRNTFLNLMDDPDVAIVQFTVHFEGHNVSVLERYPYMLKNYQPHTWFWASERVGQKRLELPHDADVLSLYILSPNKRNLHLQLSKETGSCLLQESRECRLHTIRTLLIKNVTHIMRHKHKRNFICHIVLKSPNNKNNTVSPFYRCCDTAEFHSGRFECDQFFLPSHSFSGIYLLILFISSLVTLYSPLLVLKLKMTLRFDSLTKFFRASLKHGITGQRNYVIRIASRQLVNLSDPKPFSLPRIMYRLVFHCYGEGRCCIHCWASWPNQPTMCKKGARCRKCWLIFWRVFGIIVVYPFICYLAALLYLPKIGDFQHLLNFINTRFEEETQLDLGLNLVGSALLPVHSWPFTFWMLFSFVSFVYVMTILSWPNSPFEKCLLGGPTKKHAEHTRHLYQKMRHSYRAVLCRLTYGDFHNKRHYFRVPWIPWGLRRVALCLFRVFLQIPLINVCFNLTAFDTKLFQLGEDTGTQVSIDEGRDKMKPPKPSCTAIWKGVLSLFIWIGFTLILAGYSTTVFIMTQFTLNLIFYTTLGCILHASSVLPWILLGLIIIYYLNDTLSEINREHKEILKLIDHNSPRITAAEDAEEVFTKNGTVQILKTHNLGAVKFIDGDNTEYVSKELYYNVCADLKCGWNNSFRRIVTRLGFVAIFVSFVFVALSTFGAFFGSGVIIPIVASLISLTPKVLEWQGILGRDFQEVCAFWARVIPEVLDRHIRVDRTRCLDPLEEALTTYDVRPIGILEMDIPKMSHQRSLRLWKFPWVVSADQQTHNQESFILALANKLAAASFLSKIVLRPPSSNLEEEAILRQWCLLVENCILEGSATASNINGIPIDAIRLFPEEAQHLVGEFNAGSTIDNVVDNINKELYGPFTKGVLVTIGNTTFALGKLNNTIFAFNSNCHGDQVTDLFGAVLITTDFNTQNLQTVIKYIMDPYSPDAVPVYSIVPTEGFIFRSNEAMEIDVPVIEM